MYKIVALMGKSGSGKDTILHALMEQYPKYFNEIISCTSRPKREKEINHKHYHFLSKEDFIENINNDNMIEYTFFNDWYYGTCFDVLDKEKINLGVYNPNGVRLLMNNPYVSVLPIYIVAGDKTRLLRQLLREEKPDVKEIIRRYGTDEKDFADLSDIIKDNTTTITNETSLATGCAKEIRSIIDIWTTQIN